LLDNNNKQAILQYNNNSKDIIVDNIKIIANNCKQEYVLTSLKIIKIINISNIVNININININYASTLINCVL